MEFNPSNEIVKTCLTGMSMEEKGLLDEASKYFNKAWSEAKHDFEKFISAHYVSRVQGNVVDKLNWLEKMLEIGLKINDDSIKSALPPLYSELSLCHKELKNVEKAQMYSELASTISDLPTDSGPFYHGTIADLEVGQLLTAGRDSNYKPEINMNHVYFTALPSIAGLAAALVKGEERERVYIVEPTGAFENDPNVTNKKFPGNPTRSYRSLSPLKIIGEATDWSKQTPKDLNNFKNRLANSSGEIIN
ncbi:MAG: NAD(+)--rifampin ADP-ribosyltransferase [Gammaproteobacteria bacterium]